MTEVLSACLSSLFFSVTRRKGWKGIKGVENFVALLTLYRANFSAITSALRGRLYPKGRGFQSYEKFFELFMLAMGAFILGIIE